MKLIDPITLAVLINNLFWITEEMNEYLVKSAFSTNIKVRRDCSCALYTKEGEMLAQGEFIPVHLGIMSQTLKEVLKDFPIETLEDGDEIIHNDPYRMGSHLWDVMLFKPIFIDGEIIAFSGNLAHHVDIGGSSLMFNVRTIFEEGLRIPPIKIMKKGKMQKDIIKFISNNVRTSHEMRGDLAAQTAANYRAKERLTELAKNYGVDKLLEYFEAILDYSEKGMRTAIGKLPNKEAEFEDFVENDGINDKLIKIKATVKIKDSDIFVNFKGTDKPGEGGVNSTWALTHSTVYYAVKSILAPSLPTNSGAYRPIHLIRSKNQTIVDARFPHAVGGCTCSPSQRIVDVIIGAFSKIVPDKVCACDGDWPAAQFVGIDPRNNRFSTYVETYACGRGAKMDEDGADGHQTHMTNTANAPVEFIELEHPLKVDKYALVQDSGGAGKFRGGVGICREIKTLVPMSISALSMRNKKLPYGLFGGESGKGDLCGIVLGDNKTIRNMNNASENTKVVMKTSGGGGWGNPLARNPKSVEKDVLDGYVSLEAAKIQYGCIINPENNKIDYHKTSVLRSKLKKESR